MRNNSSHSLIGLMADRRPDLLIGALGILKSGSGFAPIDPDYPDDRINYIISDCRIQILVTEEKHLARALEVSRKSSSLKYIICLDKARKEEAARRDEVQIYDCDDYATEDLAPEKGAVEPDHLAYVIYTSGSTGAPKGVPITHRNLGPLLCWSKEYFNLGERTRVLQNLNYCFDFGVFELLTTVLFGGTLHFMDGGKLSDFAKCANYINGHEINTIHSTPSFFRSLLPFVDKLESLEALHLGGEPLTGNMVDEVFSKVADNCVIYNGYGPTEATINCSIFEVGNSLAWKDKAFANIPIGKPSANNLIYILNKGCEPALLGVPGELYVGGAGLTYGYLNRADLTAERFVPNPFSNEPGARLYRTGDLARYLPSGDIEFLGRIDEQVKVRGFRIELGEIESTLSGHPAVQETVVLAREDMDGDKRLVAYVVLHEGEVPAISELRRFLQKKLPEYMVPSTFVSLESLPLSRNGKVDRQALALRPLSAPEWARTELEGDFEAPRTPVEEVMTGIWATVLGSGQLSVHDNFFDLGGHSLLVTQLISRLREAFQVEMAPRELFEAPTVAGLAKRVEALMKAGQGPPAPPIQPVSRRDPLPLSFAQQRLWFIDQMEQGNPAYNMPGAMRLTGRLNVTALEASINEIVRRHESLRTTFAAVDGKPVQVIAPALSLSLPVVELSGYSEAEREEQVRKMAAEEALKPFDLARGPLFRVRLLRLAAEEHVSLFSMHHIISDEWSFGALAHELAALYDAFRQGRPSPLPELPIQYADFAYWQRQWLQGEALDAQLAYWRRQLDGGLPVVRLPFDHPRSAAPTYQGGVHSFVLFPEVSAALKALSRQEGATLFMTLLAALQTLLHRYTGQDDIVVGTDVANRNRLETEGLIGFFVNHLVLRTKLGGNPTFRQLLRRVREVTLGAYAHQDLPFDKLVGALRPERNLNHVPLFQILFVFGNPAMPNLELPGLTLSPLRSDLVLSKYDLTLFMSEREREISGLWRYGAELFEVTTISRMSDHFVTLLGSIAANPDARLKSLEMLPESEGRRQDQEKRERQESRTKKLKTVSRKAVDL